ncbi:hypothetical protein GCM10010489_15770 [Microbacterium saperdae]|nr:hypothetical protein GCM10010489_15770 [Microbacterium saperdae]
MSWRDPRAQVWDRVCAVGGVVERLDVGSSPVLAEGSISFRRLTALTGVHGAGKSYLLSAVAGGLPGWQVGGNLPIESSQSEAEFSGEYSLALRAGAPAEIVHFSRPVTWKQRQEFDASLHPLRATRLTPYAALDELAYFTQNLSPAWPSVPGDLSNLKRSHVDALRAITGYSYETVTYGQYGERDEDFPYFRVERDSRTLDAQTMSASEFWVHWVIWHLRSADENEVVLIDEPETFLAEPGHRPFVDEIARMALESGCQVIIATHSATMIRRIPAALVRQVSSTAGGALTSEVVSTEALLRALGRSPAPVSLLVFVEDEMARTVVRFLLRRFATDHVTQVDIIDSGGKDDAVRGARIARRSRQLGTVAVLDGDQRDLYDDETILFIPGTSEPEALLMDVLRSRGRDAGDRLGVTSSDLLIAIDAARFVAHQRVFEVMSGALDVPPADLIRVALTLWLEDDSIATAARRLVEQTLALFP